MDVGVGGARPRPIPLHPGSRDLPVGAGSPRRFAARSRSSGRTGPAMGAATRRGVPSWVIVPAVRAAAALLPALLLAGCGADGPPVPPGPPPPEAATGATVTGQASLGVAGRL